MKTTFRKALALLLALTMLFCAAPLAFAEGEEDEPAAVIVDFIFSSKDMTVCLPYLYVEDGVAERYGFTQAETDHAGKPVEGITALDALVAAHECYYEDAFTAETAKDYLTYSGYLTKLFGIKTSAVSFAVNGKMPHDDVMTDWGYTGYAADTAVLAEGDNVNFFVLRDSYYQDIVPTVTLSAEEALTGEEITVSATGFVFFNYGSMDDATIAANTYPLAGADVYDFNWDGGENVKLGTLDENGQLTVTFSEAQDHVILVGGTYVGEDDDLPIATGMARVRVEAPIYNVEFNANGGEFEEGIVFYSYSREAGEAYDIPADPTREGYTFAGWDPAPDGVTPDHDVTFRAQWEESDDAPSFLQRVINAVKEAFAKVLSFFRMVIAFLTGLFKNA